MTKRFLFTTLLIAGLANSALADRMEKLTSPNGKIVANINIGKDLTYSASLDGEQILKDCPLSLQVGKELLGTNPKLKSTKRTRIDEQIRPVVPLKQAIVANKANALTLHFKGYSVKFRAYDYGVAKRKGAKWFIGAITGSKPQDITISLDFLNRPAMLTSFRDGRNAHRIAVDYKKQVQQVTPSTQLKLHLVRNGGWCGSFE